MGLQTLRTPTFMTFQWAVTRTRLPAGNPVRVRTACGKEFIVEALAQDGDTLTILLPPDCSDMEN